MVEFGGASPAVKWLNTLDQKRSEAIARAFPGQVIHQYEMSQDGKRAVVRVSAASRPPIYYFVDFGTHKADIIGAELRARTAQVTVRFVSQLISVTRDRNGNVIDGSPEKVTDVTDVWTFARDVTSRDPNWKLVATEAGH